MSLERSIMAFAGFMVLLSLVLTYFVHPNFVWLTVFVGANLFQSAFTGFCPAGLLGDEHILCATTSVCTSQLFPVLLSQVGAANQHDHNCNDLHTDRDSCHPSENRCYIAKRKYFERTIVLKDRAQ